MIGFIAGILAGVALNLENIITVDPGNWKLLLGIAGSGYIGADFIENTMSVVIPGAKSSAARTAPSPVPAPPPAPVAPPAPEARGGVSALTAGNEGRLSAGECGSLGSRADFGLREI